MLQAIGATSVEELFRDIPASLRDPRLDLPPALSELELEAELSALASRNATHGDYACFMGGGAYHHFIPAIVRHVTSRGEFATAYTPYQAEISQGTLQAIYEFQSLVCQLTGMDVANAGMYDGASALAEAALMACRVTGRRKVAWLASLSPASQAVVKTYVQALGVEVEFLPGVPASVPGDAACVMLQYPNYFGYVEDLAAAARAAHSAGALLVVSVDPIALGMFRSPGSYDADIVVAEGQSLGTPPSFGGPYVGLFACKERYLRQMPGRLVGRTVDVKGRDGFVLTLQPREQHIRRERATSNICTNEALVALAATVYLAALGRQGLRRVAELCYHKAHYAANRIASLPGYSLPLKGVFFKEFAVACPRAPARTIERLLERKILAGIDISNQVPAGLLVCVTEMNTREDIDRLVAALGELK